MVLALVFVMAVPVRAQITGTGGINYGTSVPATCSKGDVFSSTSLGKMYGCTAKDEWTELGGGSGGPPAGAIIFIDTGTCPTGYSEVSAFNGKTIIGTLAANGNVGTTGGSDTITPAGTVAAPVFTGSSANTNAVSAGTPAGTNSAPTLTGTAWTPPAIAWPAGVPTHSGTAATFAGNALGTHAHELPWQMPTTTTIRQIAVATFGTGTSRAATAVSAAGTANTTSAAVALSQAVSAGTPAGTITITNQGTVAWPAGVPTIGAYTPQGSISAPTFTGTALGTHQHTLTATGTNNAPAFTGTQFDNRSAFAYVIACKKT